MQAEREEPLQWSRGETMVESGSGESSENSICVVKVDLMVFANGLDRGYQRMELF